MRQLKYLVTGTGRCGTVYMARLLESVGIRCGHESIFGAYGLVFALRCLSGLQQCVDSTCSSGKGNRRYFGTPPDGEASYLAAPYLASGLFQKSTVIHLVRHPLRVINSFVNGLNYFQFGVPKWHDGNEVVDCGYHKFMYQYIPALAEPMTQVERAALYYTAWNEMIEKLMPLNGTRVRLEDCPSAAFEALKIDPPKAFYGSTTANSADTKGKTLLLADIPDGPIKDNLAAVAKKYGYDLSETPA